MSASVILKAIAFVFKGTETRYALAGVFPPRLLDGICERCRCAVPRLFREPNLPDFDIFLFFFSHRCVTLSICEFWDQFSINLRDFWTKNTHLCRKSHILRVVMQTMAPTLAKPKTGKTTHIRRCFRDLLEHFPTSNVKIGGTA